jgi:hypothetical protein
LLKDVYVDSNVRRNLKDHHADEKMKLKKGIDLAKLM